MTDQQSEQIHKLLEEYKRSSSGRTRLKLSSQVLKLVENGTQSSAIADVEAIQDDLTRAFRVLTMLIYDEYPTDWSLVDIAKIWGNGVSDEDLAALKRVEQIYGEPNAL